ncbi:hypothetical protein [Devosia sp. A369]
MAALLALGQSALGATSLCVEDISTGLYWENGQWKSSNFETGKYIVRPIEASEDLWNACGAEIIKLGLPEEPVVEEYFRYYYACYGVAVVGNEMKPQDVWYCKVATGHDGNIWGVSCDDSLFYQIYFEPNGEFQMTRTREARVNFGGDAGPRATMSAAAGKCSVVTP